RTFTKWFQALGCFGGRELPTSQRFEHGVDSTRAAVALRRAAPVFILGPALRADPRARHRIHDLIETRDDRGIGKAKPLFDVFDLPPALDEHLDEGELLTR